MWRRVQMFSFGVVVAVGIHAIGFGRAAVMVLAGALTVLAWRGLQRRRGGSAPTI